MNFIAMIDKTPIKIVLVVGLVLLLRAFMTQRSMVLTKRLVGAVVFLALFLLVLFPDFSTSIANKIGVGRGVDLVFYISHLFLLLLIIAMWRRTIVLSGIITKLARHIAIENAELNEPKKENQ
jgi:small membrane protein